MVLPQPSKLKSRVRFSHAAPNIAWIAQGQSVSFTRRGSAVRNRVQVPIKGSVVEWSMALVLKTSVSKGTVSSNLTASAKLLATQLIRQSSRLKICVWLVRVQPLPPVSEYKFFGICPGGSRAVWMQLCMFIQCQYSMIDVAFGHSVFNFPVGKISLVAS